MRAAKGAIGKALDRPDPAIRFYLFHGEDQSGSRALAERLRKSLNAEKSPLAASALKADPALLGSEAGAISMFGGARLLWIEPAGDEIVPAVEALLSAPAVEHPVVAIAASALRKSSKLLKLAEADRAILSETSYLPDGRRAEQLVVELGRAEGLVIDSHAAARIAAAAANDQAVIRQELVKFALYLDAAPDQLRALDEDIIDALGADSSEGDAGRAGDLALAGDTAGVSDELERLDQSGIEPIPVVRALQRRLLMLVPLRAKVEAGEPAGSVTSSLFWKEKNRVMPLLSCWTSDRLARLVERVARLERELMLSPVAGKAALGEELLQIARAARR